MPRIAFSTSVAAGATLRPLASWQYEYLPYRSAVRVCSWASAVGMTLQVSAGSEVLQVPSPVDAGGTTGHLPVPEQDAAPLDFIAQGGDRLDLAFVNTTGGAVIAMGFVDVNPV